VCLKYEARKVCDSIGDSVVADTTDRIESEGQDGGYIYELGTKDRSESETRHELHDAHRDVPVSELVLSRRYIEVRCT
jgi:hypothetical protein